MKRNELDQKLSSYHLREIRQTNRNTKSLPSLPDIKIDVLEVTLIAMGAAVLLGAIVAVVCICLSRLKHKYEPYIESQLVSSFIFLICRNVYVHSTGNEPSREYRPAQWQGPWPWITTCSPLGT